MSEHHIEVVTLGTIERHPNADTLSITHVHGGYPCILRTGDFAPGDLAIYVPVDALVPVSDPRFSFLAGKHVDTSGRYRVRAVRLRGVFSMGLLVRPNASWVEGQDVAELLGVGKYEAPEDMTTGADNEPDPGFLPVYTDIEALRKWGSNVLIPGEEVVITEKIHGCNARYVWQGGRLWCGSRTGIKRQDQRSVWWRAAEWHDLGARLALMPGFAVYGEVYGQVQDLRYGVTSGVRFAAFDVLDTNSRTFLGWDATAQAAEDLGLTLAPVLFRGPWSPELARHAEGASVLADGACLREGIVVRPIAERFDDRVGRVVLKMHGEGYLARKERP